MRSAMLSDTSASSVLAKQLKEASGPDTRANSSNTIMDGSGNNKASSIMMIRIPRSATTSPRVSTETVAGGDRTGEDDQAKDGSSIGVNSSSSATTLPSGIDVEDRQTSRQMNASHWPDPAPDALSANNNKAAPMTADQGNIEVPALGPSPFDRSNSDTKQSSYRGTPGDLPKKEGANYMTPTTIPVANGNDDEEDHDATMAIELHPAKGADGGSSVALTARTRAARQRQSEGAHLGCVEYEPFRPPLHQHPHYGPGATFEIRLPLALLRDQLGCLTEGGRPSSSTVRRRYLWGGAPQDEHLYSDDSDALCILLHQASINWEDLFAMATNGMEYLKVSFQVSPGRDHYHGCHLSDSGLKSRSWHRHSGHSWRLLGVRPSDAPIRQRSSSLSLPLATRLGPHEGCSLRFHRSGHPILGYGDLLYQSQVIREHLLRPGAVLHLLGHSHQYALEVVPKDGTGVDSPSGGHGGGGRRNQGHHHHHHPPPPPKYRLCRSRSDKEQDDVLFDDVSWEEIKWREGGLSIRSTFLNLAGYHW